MSRDYFFGKDNQKIGPFDQKTIKKKIEEGTITSQMLAWCEGMENWKPSDQIPELSSLFKGSSQPPPVPQNQETPPPLPPSDMPAGLSPLEQKAYRFATAVYRPWKGKHSPLGSYVRKNPKNAVYVSLGTIAVMLLIVILLVGTLSSEQDQGQQSAQDQQMPMDQMPPAGWQAGHRAMMDAQREIGQISSDVYTYQRDRQDKMDDFYRKATYGTDD